MGTPVVLWKGKDCKEENPMKQSYYLCCSQYVSHPPRRVGEGRITICQLAAAVFVRFSNFAHLTVNVPLLLFSWQFIKALLSEPLCSMSSILSMLACNLFLFTRCVLHLGCDSRLLKQSPSIGLFWEQ